MSTAVISLKATDTVARLREEMALAEIRHIPVVDDRNHVIGVVSNRDVKRTDKSGHAHIAEIMTLAVRTVRASTPASEAASILRLQKIGSLPVVGDDEQLVGVITETDFLAVAEQALRGMAPTPRDRA